MPTLRLPVLDGWQPTAIEWHSGAGDGAGDPSADLQLGLVRTAW